MEVFSNPLPRAVLRKNSFVLLDGEWDFAVDTKDEGYNDAWYLGHKYEYTATWPGSIEEHMLELKLSQSGKSWDDKVIAWYEREFELPATAEDTPKSMLQLTFGACGYETRVWLNGFPLKTVEGDEVHIGEYTSFSFELGEETLRAVNTYRAHVETLDA